MFREIIDRIKEAAEYVMKSRLMVLILVFCMTSTVLIGRLFYLQIVRGEDYLENYELQIRRTDSTAGTRGNIYDRNGNVLAYNELAYAVTIKDTMPADTDTDEYNEILNSTLDQVLELVEKNGDSVIDSFGIILNSAGEYEYAETNETRKLRFIADVYGQAYVDDLTPAQRNQSDAVPSLRPPWLCCCLYQVVDGCRCPYSPVSTMPPLDWSVTRTASGFFTVSCPSSRARDFRLSV